MMISCTSYSAFPVRVHDRILLIILASFRLDGSISNTLSFSNTGKKIWLKHFSALFPFILSELRKTKRKTMINELAYILWDGK